MKNLFDYLESQGIDEQSLPDEITKAIDHLDVQTVAFNDSVAEYQKTGVEDAATETMLEATENTLDNLEAGIISAIKAWKISQSQPNPVKTPPPPPAPVPVPKKEEEEEDGIGWLIFGGLALVITLGAVNVFKNR